jgi:hypothetical protein
MELLQYKYHDAYVIQASSTDIGMSWRKFRVRAKQLPPERYCNYVMASGGTLKVYNADSKAMEEVAEISTLLKQRFSSADTRALTLSSLGQVLNYPRFGFESKRRAQGMVYRVVER